MKKRILETALAILAVLAIPAAADWSEPIRCELLRNGMELHLKITGKNPRIHDFTAKLPTGEYSSLELSYTAEGLPPAFSGNIFFHGPEDRDFTAARRIPLRNLCGDGKRHDVKIPLPESWRNLKEVTALRMDPADGAAGGTLILHQVKFVKTSGAKQPVWDKENEFAGWGHPLHAEYHIDRGIAVIDIRGASPRICNFDVAVETSPYRAVEIKYRAEGVPPKTTGNLFFNHAGEADFSAGRRIPLRGLLNDGKWHLLKAELPSGWTAGKVVTALRLDPADQAFSGKIEIESIRFTAGTVRSAEELACSGWPSVKPLLPTHDGDQKLPEHYWSGRMIFSPDDKGEKPVPFAMRRWFECPENLSRALLQITADDRFAVWINGRAVANRLGEHAWDEPVSIEVTDLLQPGRKNLICVEYVNISGPGGVLLELGMLDGKGTVHKMVSDDKFKTAARPDGNQWTRPEFDDSSWGPVKTAAAPPAPPWRRVLPFRSLKRLGTGRLVEFSAPKTAIAGKPFRLALKIDAAEAIPAQKMTVKLFTLPWNVALPEKEVNLPAIPKGSSELAVDIPLPRYFSDCRMKFVLTPSAVIFDKPLSAEFSYKGVPVNKKNVSFEVRKTAVGPRLFADGRPIYMLTGNVHVGDVQSPSRLEQVPVNFRTCHIKQNAPYKIWIRGLDGQYDFSVIDRCAETRLQIDPNAYLIFSIVLGLPHEFSRDFADDISRRADGSTFRSSALTVQPGSKRCREITDRALAALVKHCEQAPYASRVAGFLVAEGETMEWQYWGSSGDASAGSLIDYSPGALKTYRERTGGEMPSPEERMTPKAGLFYDPATQSPLIRCNQFFSDIIAERLIESCRVMKQAMTVPKLVGAYYGYHFEYSNCREKRQMAGHNRLREVLDSGVVDFLVSPPSYSSRNIGNSGADMKPFTSISQAGVLSLIDDDTRTHTIHYSGCFQTLTPQQTRSVMRRNLGQYLCRQEPVWLLPLQEGREFDGPETLHDLKIFRKAAEFQMRSAVGRHPEIAVVVDERSYDLLAPDGQPVRQEPICYYEKDGSVHYSRRRRDRLTGNLISGQIERLAKIGAPVDYLLASDVGKNLDRYKLWIFLDVFQYDNAFLDAVKQLRQRKTSLVWCYAPGLISNGRIDVANMERLTGFKLRSLPGPGSPAVEMFSKSGPALLMGYPEEIEPRFAVADPAAAIRGCYHDNGAPAVAEKQIGKSDNWFFGGNCIDTEVWRRLARQAGVHLYLDTGDTLFANDRFVTVHARTAGRKLIRLPRKSEVWDLFSGTRVSETTEEFAFDAALHESRIFFLGKLKELNLD